MTNFVTVCKSDRSMSLPHSSCSITEFVTSKSLRELIKIDRMSMIASSHITQERIAGSTRDFATMGNGMLASTTMQYQRKT